MKNVLLPVAWSLLVVGSGAFAQTVTVNFDNSNGEAGITAVQAENFTVEQSAFSGGQIEAVDAALRATGAHAYAADAQTSIEFAEPAQQLRFFFVHAGSVPATVEFIDLNGAVIDSANSRLATSQGDSDNYINFNSDRPIKSVRFDGGYVDSFAYTLANAASSFSVGDNVAGGWFEPATGGQGILIDYLPTNPPQLFVAWFTYDSIASASGQAQVGSSEQRWLTAQGEISGNLATLTVNSTSGGQFDNGLTNNTVAVGNMTIDFSSCREATLDYNLTTPAISGQIVLQPIDPTQANCDIPPE